MKRTRHKLVDELANMPSITKTLGLITAGLAALASALPAVPKLTDSQLNIHSFMKRQNQLTAAAGLTDVDILQLYVPPLSLLATASQ